MTPKEWVACQVESGSLSIPRVCVHTSLSVGEDGTQASPDAGSLTLVFPACTVS